MRKISIATVSSLSLWLLCSSASAANAIQGHISEITYVDSSMLVRVDTGLTDNCLGTSGNWMAVPDTSKPMLAYLTGLWLSGAAAQTPVVVYTAAPASPGGFCTVTQVQPLQ